MGPRVARVAALLLAAGFAPALAPAAAAESPPAPYWSVHVGSFGSRAEAFAALETLTGEPAARVERRRSWHVRFGAWPARTEAGAALARVQPRFAEARVLQIENPVEWLGAGSPPATAVPAAPAAGPGAEAFETAARRLEAEFRRWLDEDGIARTDGYVYAMDVAPLMLYAALRRDGTLYARLFEGARPLLVEGADGTTRGFVLWRHKAGEAPEVTGSTEALWMARALWAAHRLLGRQGDGALVTAVLEGYERHAQGEGPAWRVSKYYAFGTQSFVGLSVLPNYHPDFLEEAGAQVSARVRGAARRSYALLQRAVTPSRLLTPVIQPDLAAALPGLDLSLYAPNGLVSLEDSCSGAEGALRGLPKLARDVLQFTSGPGRLDPNGRLFAYYDREDGQPLGTHALSTTGYACLLRLATAARDRARQAAFKSVLAGDIDALLDAAQPRATRLYSAGPLLLAADGLSGR